MSLIPSGELKVREMRPDKVPEDGVSMSLIPSGELKVTQPMSIITGGPGVSMSLIPSGELKGALLGQSGRSSKCINESNSLRGVERGQSTRKPPGEITVSMSLIPSGELKVPFVGLGLFDI